MDPLRQEPTSLRSEPPDTLLRPKSTVTPSVSSNSPTSLYRRSARGLGTLRIEKKTQRLVGFGFLGVGKGVKDQQFFYKQVNGFLVENFVCLSKSDPMGLIASMAFLRLPTNRPLQKTCCGLRR